MYMCTVHSHIGKCKAWHPFTHVCVTAVLLCPPIRIAQVLHCGPDAQPVMCPDAHPPFHPPRPCVVAHSHFAFTLSGAAALASHLPTRSHPFPAALVTQACAGGVQCQGVQDGRLVVVFASGE